MPFFMPPAAKTLFGKRVLDSQKLFIFFLGLMVLYVGGFGQNTDTGFVVTPYLPDVTTDSATVAFQIDRPLAAYVKLYYDSVTKEFHSPKPGKSHVVKVTGLLPGTSYRYEVICGKNEIRTPVNDESFQLKTACLPGESFVFTVFGDPRPGDNQTYRHHAEIIEQVVLQEPAFNLILGDMVDDGREKKQWQEFFKIESPLMRRTATFPVMGDNDYAQGKGVYADYFPRLKEKYYRFHWGGIHFFGLYAWDTRGNQPQDQFDEHSPQYQWFQQEMQRPEVQDAPFRVVFLHDPVYISRGRASESLRRLWTPLFQKYKVDVVFSSWHLYERSNDKNITYIITGGGGAELIWMNANPAFPSQVDARQYHFCRVEIDAGGMNIRSIAKDGTVLDSISLSPRSNNPEDHQQAQRAAHRMAKEIIINKTSQQKPVLPVYLFASNCNFCRRLLNHRLPYWARKNGITIKVNYFDLSKEGTYNLFLNAGAQFGRQGAQFPALFVGRTILGGQQQIETGFPLQIKQFIADPKQYRANRIEPFKRSHDTIGIGQKSFNALTLGIVMGAGLLDGINPCAFTTIIFLISYLTFVGASRQQILITGGTFTLAVFVTYLAIGLLFFNVARVILEKNQWATVINFVMFLAVIGLAVFSFYDFLKCLKGQAGEMALQLPGFLKRGIHDKIRKLVRSNIAVISTTFVLGIVIAGMELTCTGQVYIPIVTMISEPQHRVMAIAYLFLYNIAFIVPLVAVFILVALGLSSEKLSVFFKRHIALVKLGFTSLFLVMALVIAYNLRWL